MDARSWSAYIGNLPVQHYREGATGYNSGTGIWYGIDTDGLAKLFVGNSAANKLLFDGTNVSITGSVTATTGTIGGWTLGATALTAGSGATTVGLDSGGTNPAIYAGSATPASAPFRVTQAGALTATSATITGTIDIANATQTFTPSSWLGFSADPSGDISYLDLGNIVFMWRDTALTGTSDEAFMVLNGVPAGIRPSAGRVAKCFVQIGTDVVDGSATVSDSGVITFGASDTTTVAGRVVYSADFPTSGSKGLPAGWFIAYSR